MPKWPLEIAVVKECRDIVTFRIVEMEESLRSQTQDDIRDYGKFGDWRFYSSIYPEVDERDRTLYLRGRARRMDSNLMLVGAWTFSSIAFSIKKFNEHHGAIEPLYEELFERIELTSPHS